MPGLGQGVTECWSVGVLVAFHHSISPLLQEWTMEKVVHLIQKRKLWQCIVYIQFGCVL